MTTAGRDYLSALAALGGEARAAELADALGRRPSELTMTLKMLKDRGAVRVPRRGSVAFSRPGMDVWVRDEQAG